MNVTEKHLTDVFRSIPNNKLLALTAGELAKKDPDFGARLVKMFKEALSEIEKAMPEDEDEEEGNAKLTDDQVYELVSNSGKLRDGELEMDAGATISRGSDNGAYVQVWLWVDFPSPGEKE